MPRNQDKKQVKKIAKKQAAMLDKKIALTPGPQGEQGPPGAPGETGPAGTAKGFGHWFGGTGVQDVANAENVEIAAAGPSGEYCINAVGFTPKKHPGHDRSSRTDASTRPHNRRRPGRLRRLQLDPAWYRCVGTHAFRRR